MKMANDVGNACLTNMTFGEQWHMAQQTLSAFHARHSSQQHGPSNRLQRVEVFAFSRPETLSATDHETQQNQKKNRTGLAEDVDCDAPTVLRRRVSHITPK